MFECLLSCLCLFLFLIPCKKNQLAHRTATGHGSTSHPELMASLGGLQCMDSDHGQPSLLLRMLDEDAS